MSRRDTHATLSQILHHAQLAEQLCHGRTLPEFVRDWKSALALERILEIIGEAVKRLPSEVCASHAEVEWRLVAGMRDRLSHGYDEVDYEILWNVVQEDLPNLINTVEQMLGEMGGELG